MSRCYLKCTSKFKIHVFLLNCKAKHMDPVEIVHNLSQCTLSKNPSCTRLFAKCFIEILIFNSHSYMKKDTYGFKCTYRGSEKCQGRDHISIR